MSVFIVMYAYQYRRMYYLFSYNFLVFIHIRELFYLFVVFLFGISPVLGHSSNVHVQKCGAVWLLSRF